LTGMRPHVEAIDQLARMHVYVQCSAFEGMPNTLLEAASVGVPIVATAVGGVKEIFTDGHDALLVPHGDPGALTAGIERVLADANLANTLSRNAARLCARFSQDRERAEWVNLHRRFLTHEKIACAGVLPG
jgi:glycosyltransferase involved in cell wall biosynthesis